MDKAKSKYFNTSLLMDQALMLLLEKKDLEYITVKELCQKAGVNRSTFYLHYENMSDLFSETVEMLNNEFYKSFEKENFINAIRNGNPEDAVFIKPEYIVPYLVYVKKNKKILQIIHNKPNLFNNDKAYKDMCEKVFYPILTKFNVPEQEIPFKLEFFTRGSMGIINKWLELNCELPIEKVAELIVECVGFNK